MGGQGWDIAKMARVRHAENERATRGKSRARRALGLQNRTSNKEKSPSPAEGA
ncbi:MAG: hypothetical protein LBS67_05650 [Clostridiales Family XIII bacterium]|nr:hypothetical protein [Clostridiales Family XIII bacterium]